ncbi:uncharacterized protein [Oryctolagus cuniculus]|uniref:uncharacterized protein n=1 Tax=Oryctolagus cuniculus TaxID=9986 RepID=UPI00387913C9
MAMPYAGAEEKRHSRRVDSLHRRPLLPLRKAWPSQPTVAISRQAGARAGEGKEVLFSPTELRSGLKSGEEMQGPWRQPSGHQPFVSWLSEADLFRDCSPRVLCPIRAASPARIPVSDPRGSAQSMKMALEVFLRSWHRSEVSLSTRCERPPVASVMSLRTVTARPRVTQQESSPRCPSPTLKTSTALHSRHPQAGRRGRGRCPMRRH